MPPRTQPSPTSRPNPRVRKASFNLPEDELEKLRALAARRSITITQALREAIADSEFLARQQDANNELLVKSEDGQTSKVILQR
jgi:predicted transcriptional regulator